MENNADLTKLIQSGSLFLLNSVGAGGELKELYTKQYGEVEGAAMFDKAVASSEYYYNIDRDTQGLTLDQARQNLLSAKQDYDFRKLANPINLRIMAGQEKSDELQRQQLAFQLKTMPKEFALKYFGTMAETLGEKALNSPEVIKLAKDLGINLNPYRE